MTSERIHTLSTLIEKSPFNAVALNPGPTLTYLTGLNFHLMERPFVLLVAPPAVPALILPELEAGKLAQSKIKLQSFMYTDNPATWPQAFKNACDALNIQKQEIGVEPTQLRVLELRYLEAAAPEAHFAPAEAMISELRLRKDASEIASMRKAAQIAQAALAATLPKIRAGVTEREIAAELTIQLLNAGSETDFPFHPSVSGGPNGAVAHMSGTDRKLMNGDLLLIDWGARFNGYCSDLTRTFAVGTPDDETKRIYDLVLAANAAGRAAGKPGVPAGTVDDAARGVINAGGYGPYFNHRTGHGLGMEVHEPPYMYAENTQILEPGMVYTVEPGIYLTGRNGVRIEDDIVITPEGCESLSDYPRELTILG